MTQTQDITKDTIKETMERMKKFRFLQDYFAGFPSAAFPKGDFTENKVRRLAEKQGTTFDSLVDDLYDWTEGKNL